MKFLSGALAALLFATFAVATVTAAEPLKPVASFDVGSTHVDKYGSGEPALILIPGLTDSAAEWAGTVAQFAPTHAVYALTLAGFGGRVAAQAPLLDKAEADVIALMAQEHLRKPVVIGHSLGGHLAIRIAEDHSDLLRGGIAVDGLPVFPGYEGMTAAVRASSAAQATAPIAKETHDQFMLYEKTQFIPFMTRADNVPAVAALSEGADPAATAQYMKEMLSADLRPGLAKIHVPFLELAPYDDTMDAHPPVDLPNSEAKKAYYLSLLTNNRRLQVNMIENSRHFIMYDQPQAFYDAVSAFLKTLP